MTCYPDPPVARGHALRGAAGLWLAALTAGALGTGLTLRLLGLVGSASTSRVDGFVELGVVAVGAAVLAWLTLSCAVAAVCLTARAAGAGWRRGEVWLQRWAPMVVRRAVVIAVGAGIGLSAATGASAADAGPTGSPLPTVSVAADPGRDLGWVPTEPGTSALPSGAPAATVTAEPTPTPAAPLPSAHPLGAPPSAGTAAGAARTVSSESPGPAHTTSSSPPGAAGAAAAPETVTVARGDTLWAIAARHLPAGADDAQIAAAWPVWYAANATRIGSDPDLIRPGLVLSVPVELQGSTS
ncbi:LysM peptidoglycan-binding domain-containing protein [Cellulomonas sp. SG140]|uniref:LysM peptidoglycan-binding domain-containing protein n=1 Tax=Cellulomonas sp. SG140 TaxID=2976536 RepID=UPI0021E6F57B|nr:LysM domain-containing protein [Cellulomonas sp. SG140]